MKLIVRLIVAMVACSSHLVFAAKPPPTPPPAAGTECANKGGVFPAMAYSHGVYSGGGRYTKTQIFVANSLGTCQVMVYDTGDYSGWGVDVSFHYDSSSRTGTLSWIQTRDNGAKTAGYVIKVAQFTVGGDNTVMGLPLAATTIYRAPTTPTVASIFDVELSPDATRLAFSTDQAGTSSTPETHQVLICTLATCALTAEVAFSYTGTAPSGTSQVTIGHNNPPENEAELERIYFIYRPNASFSDGDLVAIDNLGGGTWTAPVVLVNRDVSYMASVGETDTFLDRPSALSRPGEADRVLLQSSATFINSPPRVDVYDTGTGDLAQFLGTGYRPSWTFSPSIGAAPKVLTTQLQNSTNGSIKEIDLNGAPEITLPPNISGYNVDSAN
jgi:hypothetical protein